MAKEWWEDAPVANDAAEGGAWWEAAPLADAPAEKKGRTWGEAIGDTGRAVGDELGKLRDSFFTGVDNTRAATNAVGVGAQANQIQKTNDRLAELMSYGEGDSPEAQGLRKTAEHYTKRMPTMISGMTEAQADAQRGAQMTTRPAVAAMGEAKTFGDAWEIFKQHPYDVIAGVTATSLPTMLPALATGAVLGPGAGAVAMGGSSAITEAGSSLAEFARDKGVNTTDPKAVEAFFSDRQNLADAMSYAGKRAGIIGALDAASGGVAGKTIAPAFKSVLAKQAVNMPAQMAVQAGLGAAGEAGGQLATKGRIDEPGQVLMEAVGELAGAPLEVAAFSKDAFKAATQPAEQTKVTPADIVSPEVQSVDEAIAVTQAAIADAKPAESSSPADLLGTQAQTQNQSFLGAARETQAQAQTDAADLADLAQSETRNLQVMRAQTEQDQAKAAELEQIRAQSMEPLGRLPDQQVSAAMAATDETPTAMQLAMQKALAGQVSPNTGEDTKNTVSPTVSPNIGDTPALPRLVERTPGMVAMPQKLAQQRAAANPALEAVRIQNQNGKFAYTVIPRTADVSPALPVQPAPAGTDQRGAPEPAPSLAPGVGLGGDTGTAVVAGRGGNLPSSGPVLPANQPAAVDQRLIPVSKREASRENAAQAPQEARAAAEPAAVPGAGSTTLPTVTQEQTSAQAPEALEATAKQQAPGPVPATAEPAADAGVAAKAEAVGPELSGEVVSTYAGKYGKGMGKEAARLEAQRLNRTGDKNVTYAAEEHGDSKLENPWAVVGRKVVKSADGGNPIPDAGRNQPVAREQPTAAPDRDGQRGALLSDASMAAADVDSTGSAGAVPESTGAIAKPGASAVGNGEQTDVRNQPGQPDDLTDIDPATRASAILDAAGVTGTERRESIKDVKAGNITIDELAKIHPAKEAPKAPPADVAQFSRADGDPEQNALQALSQMDELFKLPKSNGDTVQSIATDNDPAIKVKESKLGPETLYALTMPDGAIARIWVRPANKYGERIYSMELKDGEMSNATVGRPGENAESVPDDMEDVYIDVSNLKEGGYGSKVYNIAATYAHNTGRIMIGDPSGLSDTAMRRRTEHMLSSALKFGTTSHLAPHPRQISGDSKIGVPPLDWTYGDDLANIESLIRVSTEAFDHATANPFTFDAATGTFRDSEGAAIDDDGISLAAKAGSGHAGKAGSATLKRNAVLNSLLREPGSQGGGRGQGVGILARLVELGRQYPASTNGIFYARGERTSTGLTQAQFTTELAKAFGAKVADRLQAKGVVVPLADQSQLPAHVVPFLRDGDRVYGFYDPKTDRTYAVLENLTPEMVKGLTLHEVGVHYGFKAMLGDAKYANVMQRLDVMRRAGSKAVKEAYAEAKKNAVRESQVPEETLAYLVQTHPEMGLVKEIIARIKAFLFNEFGIGGKYLTEADLTMLARAAVNHSSRMEDGGSVVPAFMRGTTEPVTKSNDVVGNQGGRSADDTTPGDFPRVSGLVDGLEVRDDIPNRGSISAELNDYDILPGVREIPFSAFTQMGALKYYSVSEEKRTKQLAERIKESGEINPLIVVIDKEGPYILEGGHRFDALRELGKKSLPALVVLDNESLNEPTAPDSGGAMFSRSQIVGQTSPHSWNSPEASKFDDLVYRLQDKHIDTKRVIDAIRDTAATLADEKDVYLQEELFHGRAAARTEDFVSKELGPLVTEMKMRGIDIPTLDEYLHARHAEEANELIAQRNPDIQDGGSGMTTKAARDYLAKLDPAERKRLEAVAAKVDAILSTTRQMYADYHLESDATVKGWGQMFKHYVPLMREDKDGGMGIGQGFSIKGKETKGRTGSTRKVVDILANIAMQRERAIVRGEKNRVSTALVGLVELNPNEDFWAVGPPPVEKVYDAKTDSVVERADPLFKSRDNVIVAKVKQANGEVVEKAVRFNEDNERAMRMAVALKNLDAAQLNGVLGVSAKITRYFSAISTQYNPIFGVVNLVRDFQGAILNLSSTQLKGHGKEIAGHTLSALKGIYLDTRAARDGKTPTSAWATLWEEFQDEGGQTGYRDMFANSADRAKAIEHELNPTAWMDSPLGKVFTAGGALKVPLTLAQKKATGLFGWLSDYNLAMENAVRLSAYKVGLEQGMTKQQAASLGKNLTVNFNRRGQVGQQVGAIYAFYNAATQGSARLGQTLFDMDGSDVKSIRLSATGKKIVYGGVLLGSAQALLLAAAGFDDEEPPDFVRERSLIIPTGGKSYITIPMPLGLHVIPNMGRIPTEFVLGGFRQPAKHVLKLLGLTAGAFNPIGGGASLVQMLSPTAVDPLVALAENKDWTGKPIAKTSYNKAIPGHALVKDTASGPAKLLAEAINTMTGGTKYTAGVFSPTPDQIDYLWGQATGGVGRELGKAQQTVSATMSGEDLPVHKIPLVGRFYGNADTQSAQSSKFYATINRLNEHEAEIKGLRKDHKVVELADYIKSNPDARLFERANAVEREVQKLRRIKRELVALDSPPERIKAVEARITQLMTGFNEQAARLKQAP